MAKAPWQDKRTWQIIESIRLNTMCVIYNHHFAIYNNDKTKLT
jgi:hypothetical protein